MTIEQAVAILEAERVLQRVGANGPDCDEGSAWFEYVKKAYSVVQSDSLFRDSFNDLQLITYFKGCDGW